MNKSSNAPRSWSELQSKTVVDLRQELKENGHISPSKARERARERAREKARKENSLLSQPSIGANKMPSPSPSSSPSSPSSSSSPSLPEQPVPVASVPVASEPETVQPEPAAEEQAKAAEEQAALEERERLAAEEQERLAAAAKEAEEKEQARLAAAKLLAAKEAPAAPVDPAPEEQAKAAKEQERLAAEKEEKAAPEPAVTESEPAKASPAKNVTLVIFAAVVVLLVTSVVYNDWSAISSMVNDLLPELGAKIAVGLGSFLLMVLVGTLLYQGFSSGGQVKDGYAPLIDKDKVPPAASLGNTNDASFKLRPVEQKHNEVVVDKMQKTAE